MSASPRRSPHVFIRLQAHAVVVALAAGILLTACASRPPRGADAQTRPAAPESSADTSTPPTPSPPVHADDSLGSGGTGQADGAHVSNTPPAVAPRNNPAVPNNSRRELFPGVFVDLMNKTVDFAGIVPIDVNDAAAPVVYVEVVACTPDTKEHESLVMTSVKPSNVHAALLLIGLQPGAPGRWDYQNEQLLSIDPTGDAVDVRVTFTDSGGVARSFSPQQMITDVAETRHFGDADGGHWVFAGSRLVTRQGREWYDADGAGMLVGLATFGAETIAWSKTFSPDSNLQQPEWIADRRVVPPAGTPVTILLRPAAK
ncbi:MAG: YdjY domain-containing protein [Phycisphaerales bacterium]